jgi:glycosyltransferase involved in cell wall biosynthesis
MRPESEQMSAAGVTNKTVTIVVPAYNEEKAIERTVRELASHYPNYELLVINDGSTDRTEEILAGLPCRVVSHKPNRGYGATWKTGCREANGDLIVFFDGDGQFDVKDIDRLLRHHIGSGADMTSGARQRASHAPLLRQPGKFVLRQLAINLARTKIPDINCGMRVFDRKLLLRYLPLVPDTFSASTTTLLTFLKRRHVVEFVPVITTAREGTSSVSITRDGVRAIILIIRMITLFDPLWVFLPTSALLMLLGIIYSLVEALFAGGGVPVLGATVFLTGLLIFFMGILCDQVSAVRLQGLEREFRESR